MELSPEINNDHSIEDNLVTPQKITESDVLVTKKPEEICNENIKKYDKALMEQIIKLITKSLDSKQSYIEDLTKKNNKNLNILQKNFNNNEEQVMAYKQSMDSKSISDQIKFMFILEKNDLVIKETNKMISKTPTRAATPQQISDKFKKYSNSTSTLTPNKTAPKSKPYTNRPSKTPIKTSTSRSPLLSRNKNSVVSSSNIERNSNLDKSTSKVRTRYMKTGIEDINKIYNYTTPSKDRHCHDNHDTNTTKNISPQHERRKASTSSTPNLKTRDSSQKRIRVNKNHMDKSQERKSLKQIDEITNLYKKKNLSNINNDPQVDKKRDQTPTKAQEMIEKSTTRLYEQAQKKQLIKSASRNSDQIEKNPKDKEEMALAFKKGLNIRSITHINTNLDLDVTDSTQNILARDASKRSLGRRDLKDSFRSPGFKKNMIRNSNSKSDPKQQKHESCNNFDSKKDNMDHNQYQTNTKPDVESIAGLYEKDKLNSDIDFNKQQEVALLGNNNLENSIDLSGTIITNYEKKLSSEYESNNSVRKPSNILKNSKSSDPNLDNAESVQESHESFVNMETYTANTDKKKYNETEGSEIANSNKNMKKNKGGSMTATKNDARKKTPSKSPAKVINVLSQNFAKNNIWTKELISINSNSGRKIESGKKIEKKIKETDKNAISPMPSRLDIVQSEKSPMDPKVIKGGGGNKSEKIQKDSEKILSEKNINESQKKIEVTTQNDDKPIENKTNGSKKEIISNYNTADKLNKYESARRVVPEKEEVTKSLMDEKVLEIPEVTQELKTSIGHQNSTDLEKEVIQLPNPKSSTSMKTMSFKHSEKFLNPVESYFADLNDTDAHFMPKVEDRNSLLALAGKNKDQSVKEKGQETSNMKDTKDSVQKEPESFNRKDSEEISKNEKSVNRNNMPSTATTVLHKQDTVQEYENQIRNAEKDSSFDPNSLDISTNKPSEANNTFDQNFDPNLTAEVKTPRKIECVKTDQSVNNSLSRPIERKSTLDIKEKDFKEDHMNNKKNGDYFDETEDCNDLKFDNFDVEVYDTLSKHSDIDPNDIPERKEL